MRRTTGNINGENGQTGALRTFELDASFEVIERHGGAVLEVDPGGGALTVTLPDAACGSGFFAEVFMAGTGTITYASTASIVSPGGATQQTTQYSSVRLRRRGDGSWALEGALS